MIHRLILSSALVFALAACQNQTALQSGSKPEQKKTVMNHSESLQPDKKKGEPQMSVGLPPDEEAVRIAEQEQAVAGKQGIIYINEGEQKFLKPYEMNVTFKKITEDSRCPKDVQCVWAGNAVAEVELMGTYTRPVTVRLSTIEDAKKGLYKTQEFNGYKISLVQVTPETTSSKGFKALQGHYRIGLKIEKGTAADPTVQRGGAATR